MGINWLPSPAAYVFAATRPRRRDRSAPPRSVTGNLGLGLLLLFVPIVLLAAIIWGLWVGGRWVIGRYGGGHLGTHHYVPLAPGGDNDSALPHPAGDRVGTGADAPTCNHPRWTDHGRMTPYCGHSDCINFRPKELGKW